MSRHRLACCLLVIKFPARFMAVNHPIGIFHRYFYVSIFVQIDIKIFRHSSFSTFEHFDLSTFDVCPVLCRHLYLSTFSLFDQSWDYQTTSSSFMKSPLDADQHQINMDSSQSTEKNNAVRDLRLDRDLEYSHNGRHSDDDYILVGGDRFLRSIDHRDYVGTNDLLSALADLGNDGFRLDADLRLRDRRDTDLRLRGRRDVDLRLRDRLDYYRYGDDEDWDLE